MEKLTGIYKDKELEWKYKQAVDTLKNIARDGERSSIKYTPANQAAHFLHLFGESIPANEFNRRSNEA